MRISVLFALALGGAGCTVIVHDDGQDDDHDDNGDSWERCYDDYEECLDDADGAMGAVSACNEGLDHCTGAHDADEPTTGSADEGPGTSVGQDDAGDEPPAEVCVSLQQTCLADADSDAETLACQALFDHCVHPGQCEEPCPHACSEEGLAGCLEDYGGCVADATKDYEVEACGLVFHGCIAEQGGSECLPEDDAQVEGCLAEHALCTACADDGAELAACQDIFSSCVQPPM